jgi:hypothetical protein
MSTARQLRTEAEDEKRLADFFIKLETLIPEPPQGWREKALPPGSAPRTGGKPGA